MKEIRQIVAAYDQYKLVRKKCALATVVNVQGSAYRKSGARMLIAEDGQLTGAISGGCLEGDAMRKALNVIQRNQPAVVTYDTMDEDDAILGVGLGCNGIIHILIEPLDFQHEMNAVEVLRKCTKSRKNHVVVTLFSLDERKADRNGTYLCYDGKEMYGDTGRLPGFFRDELNQRLEYVFAEAQNNWYTIKETPGNTEWIAFCEYILPSISLVVFGAGNDVIPITQMAEILGWEITVIDGRPALAVKERFSGGCHVIVSKPEKALDHITVDERTVFALMTHNYNYDKALIPVLLNTPARYIGMLGPKKKLERMLEEYNGEGLKPDPALSDRIYSPAGLDIGNSTPEEIALSIVSEINAVMNGKMHSRRKPLVLPAH